MESRNSAIPEMPILPLASVTFVVGVGGMAISFVFLASTRELDVLSGAVGFLGGAILAAVGVLALALQNRSPEASALATRGLKCLYGISPAAIAIVGWPILYFSVFVLAMFIMPVVILVCAIYAWEGSRTIAENIMPSLGWKSKRAIHILFSVTQLIAIAASLPIFGWLLNTLEAMGYKVGWS